MKPCLFPRCDCPDGCKVRKRPPMLNMWVSDFGEIRLPSEFPVYIFRKDGWWDHRFKALREKWEAWINAETAVLAMACAIPNRLHGAVINESGEAI